MRMRGNPCHTDLLTAQDRRGYIELQQLFAEFGVRRRRKDQSNWVNEMLEKVRSYAIRDDGEDYKRCVVCGVFWLEKAIALSNRQLMKLVGKCKSSINAGLNSIGYAVVPLRVEHLVALIDKCPFIKNPNSGMREWSIRVKEENIAAESDPLAADEGVCCAQPPPSEGALLLDDQLDDFYDPDECY